MTYLIHPEFAACGGATYEPTRRLAAAGAAVARDLRANDRLASANPVH
jgi:hypothetical protein